MAKGKIEWGRMLGKLSPYTILKGLRYMKHYGPKEFWIRLHERFEPEEVPYGPWYEEYKVKPEELEKQKKKKWNYEPKISVVVPAYKTPEKFLREMIDSLLAQSYVNWELCIANASPDEAGMSQILEEYCKKDARICVKPLLNNAGIAENTNEALKMATGDFIGLLDHDDLLAPNALYEVAKALESHPKTDVIYTDEDKVRADLSEHFQPNLKPDFNLDLLRSNNYICHFFVVRRTIVETIGGFRKEYDGAQDYDFVLRCVEYAENVVHIPKVLYHWRAHKDSTAENPESKLYAFEAGARAVQAHYNRIGINAKVESTKYLGIYRSKYQLQEKPLISIIIPNKDHIEDLDKCIISIEKKSTYKNVEYIIVENNSEEERTFEYYKKMEAGNPKVRVVKWEKEFNYSAINNFGVTFAHGDYYLFLNNDTEIINENCLEEMMGYCQRKEVGSVGARLFYEDGTIQHAEVIVGLQGVAGHVSTGLPHDTPGYFGRAIIAHDCSAVTAACMLVKKEAFEKVNGFDTDLAVAFNDIDFCLKIREAGYLIVYNPYAELYHYESKSRGMEDNEKKVKRFMGEIKRFHEKWFDILYNGDPYYNPNLTLLENNFNLRHPCNKRG